jgi:hypothetical protein
MPCHLAANEAGTSNARVVLQPRPTSRASLCRCKLNRRGRYLQFGTQPVEPANRAAVVLNLQLSRCVSPSVLLAKKSTHLCAI